MSTTVWKITYTLKSVAPMPWTLFKIYAILTVLATIIDVARSWTKQLYPESGISQSPRKSILPDKATQNPPSQAEKAFSISHVLSSVFDRTFKIVMCFSVLSNLASVMRLEKKPDELGFLHGLRGILSFSIIFFHYRVFCFTRTQKGTELSNVFNLARISVSWFFIISSMLNAMVNLKKIQSGNFSCVKYLLKRFARLAPVVYAAYFVIMFVPLPHTSTSRIPKQVKTCMEANWLQTLAMVSSLFTNTGLPQCFVHVWYVEADMFFCVVTLPALFFLHKIPRITILALVSYSLYRSFHYYQLSLEGADLIKSSSMTTKGPFTHAWTIGLATGCFIWKYPNKSMPKVIAWPLWAGFYLVCVAAPIYIVTFLYGNLHHIQLLWIVTNYFVCWALYDLIQDTKSYLHRFLSHPFWLPFSRVSYSTFVFHIIFAYQIMETSTTGSNSLDTLRALATSCGLYVATFVPGILVEEPFQKVVNTIF